MLRKDASTRRFALRSQCMPRVPFVVFRYLAAETGGGAKSGARVDLFISSGALRDLNPQMASKISKDK